jgi:hypothetical protein
VALSIAFWVTMVVIPPESSQQNLKGGLLLLFWLLHIACTVLLAKLLGRSGVFWGLASILTLCLLSIPLAILSQQQQKQLSSDDSTLTSLPRVQDSIAPKTVQTNFPRIEDRATAVANAIASYEVARELALDKYVPHLQLKSDFVFMLNAFARGGYTAEEILELTAKIHDVIAAGRDVKAKIEAIEAGVKLRAMRA